MVEIRLYGKLRQYDPGYSRSGSATLQVESCDGETLETLLTRLGIGVGEINHVFLNSRLLYTHNTHARLYDLPGSETLSDEWDLGLTLNASDRIGLFGSDIPLLSM